MFSIPLFSGFNFASSGECKEAMMKYLKCMKENKQQSTECRPLSKAYLACRMDKLSFFFVHPRLQAFILDPPSPANVEPRLTGSFETFLEV